MFTVQEEYARELIAMGFMDSDYDGSDGEFSEYGSECDIVFEPESDTEQTTPEVTEFGASTLVPLKDWNTAMLNLVLQAYLDHHSKTLGSQNTNYMHPHLPLPFSPRDDPPETPALDTIWPISDTHLSKCNTECELPIIIEDGEKQQVQSPNLLVFNDAVDNGNGDIVSIEIFSESGNLTRKVEFERIHHIMPADTAICSQEDNILVDQLLKLKTPVGPPVVSNPTDDPSDDPLDHTGYDSAGSESTDVAPSHNDNGQDTKVTKPVEIPMEADDTFIAQFDVGGNGTLTRDKIDNLMDEVPVGTFAAVRCLTPEEANDIISSYDYYIPEDDDTLKVDGLFKFDDLKDQIFNLSQSTSPNTMVSCTSPTEFAVCGISKEDDIDISSEFSEDENVSVDTQDFEELKAQLIAQIDAINNREIERNESFSTDEVDEDGNDTLDLQDCESDDVMDTEAIESEISDEISDEVEDENLDHDLNALLNAESSESDSLEKAAVSTNPSEETMESPNGVDLIRLSSSNGRNSVHDMLTPKDEEEEDDFFTRKQSEDFFPFHSERKDCSGQDLVLEVLVIVLLVVFMVYSTMEFRFENAQ